MECKHCKNEFIPIPQAKVGVFCSHACYNEYQHNKYEEKYYKDPKTCKNCDIVIQYEKRKNIFCSSACGATYNNKKRSAEGYIPSHKRWVNGESSTHMSSKIKRSGVNSSDVWGDFTIIAFEICDVTGKSYVKQTPNGGRHQRSPYVKTEQEKYYEQSKFRFNVYNYPDKFDLSLIEEYGWYTCPGKKRKNEKRNIHGVSRDHIISINEGFKNGYDPAHLAHPANCRLLKQIDNIKKFIKSDLTYDKLLDKIESWDK